jgi:VWFA-related protein
MRKLAVLLLLAGLALPAFAAKRVTVEQLEQALAAAQGKSDAEVARQLSNFELTERFSSLKLSRWKSDLPGDKARQALVALADASAFLDPPAAEIPSTPAPDFAAQRQIMGLVVHYVSTTIPQLPNFLATRATERFEDSPREQNMQSPLNQYRPLHRVGSSNASVIYRDGKEVVDAEPAKAEKPTGFEQGLRTWGEFGPILSTILVDAARNKLVWSRWEQGAAGPLAVFTYAVPREKSHYEVAYCCIPDSDGIHAHPFQQLAGYHGEMSVDPATGTILRLKLEADMKATDPVVKASIVVEYGPMEIGGKSYICPLKSIAYSAAQALQTMYTEPLQAAPVCLTCGSAAIPNSQYAYTELGPVKTLLNDIVFEQYHLFRAEVRVVPGMDAEIAPGLPPLGAENTNPASAENANSPSPAAKPPETAAAGKPSPAPPAESSVPATPPAPPTSSAPEPANTEISMAEATGIPDAPANSHPTMPGTGFTLRTTARLVDVGVVASDKKGHPVTDLKPGDFEIYDNGRKQELRYFSQAAGEAPEQASAVSGPPVAGQDQTAGPGTQSVFSNRHSAAGDGKSVATTAESNVTILLLDGSNLAFGDLTYARSEALRFLKALPANERVGLYAMKSVGFQVLSEETTDHALLEAKLAQWMPSAQDLANAQTEEQRNRQQIEWVHSIEDLLYVNGHTSNDPEGHNQTLDPQLRDWGSDPGRDAMAILVGVARHLAALPGHKNLVWISSDNVLADWSNKAVSIEKSSRLIESFALRAQEAMNDAHVSIYPLDASQLEAAVVDASIGNRNVELAPTVPVIPALVKMQEGPEATAGQDLNINQRRDLNPGRLTAQMQQDTHPIQGPIRHLAEATGGRVFRRSGSIVAELDGVVNDGRAAYLLSFTPDQPADGTYHLLTVKLAGRRDITLRYRTGYQYDKEPATLKDRFRQAIWQPADVAEIALTAKPLAAAKGLTLKLNIAATDLDLAQQGEFWAGKLDIFLVERDDAALHAKVTGQTMALRLKPATYQKLMRDGIPLEQSMEIKPDTGSVRVVVVDENTGRMGSVTIPTTAIGGNVKM